MRDIGYESLVQRSTGGQDDNMPAVDRRQGTVLE
jgi:hypothetical protein